MTANNLYILKDGEPFKCDDLIEWAQWMETAERRIKVSKGKTYLISTVFLGLDHAIFETEPVLYETGFFFEGEMIEAIRATTEEQAIANHDKLYEGLEDMHKMIFNNQGDLKDGNTSEGEA